jgi:hypothetical protein
LSTKFLAWIVGQHPPGDVRVWLTALLAAERITTTVIRGGRLGAGHGRPARMSESHAGTASKKSFSRFLDRDRKSSFTKPSTTNQLNQKEPHD